jgi:sialic acid synthase
MAAVALGVDYLERHFTLDRASKGTDHAASLEPEGMRKVAKYIADTKKALTYKQPEVLDCERGLRVKKCGM